MKTFHALDGRQRARDLLAGLVLAVMSLPVAMGFALVAGLPAQYGLYGSVLPALVCALLTGSPRFVFGVEAAPAALTGVLLAQIGVAHGTAEAAAVVPAVTLMTALWLGLFWLVRGGRAAVFISESVLGGCVSGIGCTVLLDQLPRLFGGESPEGGEALELFEHLFHQLAKGVHPLSLALGLGTIALIYLCRRFFPRVPISLLLMAGGAGATALFGLDRLGVALMAPTGSGILGLVPPDFALVGEHFERIALSGLTMALVIASETLVASRADAREHGETLDNQRELLAYAAGSAAAALVGCCPVNGSISRTHRLARFGAKSQWAAVSAAAVMALLALFGSDLIALLPVPVVTGIVITALVDMLEFKVVVHMWKKDRVEVFVFLGAFLAELLGLMLGVLAGVLLSFVAFTLRASRQRREFLGCMKGRDGFYALSQVPHAKPVRGALVYEFHGALFFGSIDGFEEDIKNALRPDTRLVVVTGITDVDVTGAERLLEFYRYLKEHGAALYLAGHAGAVNERLLDFGAGELIRAGAVRQRLTHALAAEGFSPPYPLERGADGSGEAGSAVLENFSWAYGKYAGELLRRLAKDLAENILANGGVDYDKLMEAERTVAGDYWNATDEDEFLDLLAMYLASASVKEGMEPKLYRVLEDSLLEHHAAQETALWRRGDEAAATAVITRCLWREVEFRRRHPDADAAVRAQRERYVYILRKTGADGLAARIEALHEEVEAVRH